MQVSARSGSHEAHAAPFGPQVVSERTLQVDPVQQPEAQLSTQPLHAPAAQVSVPGQVWQAEPAAPHAPIEVPG